MKILQIGAKVGTGEGIGKGNAGDTAIGSAFKNLFQSDQLREADFPRGPN